MEIERVRVALGDYMAHDKAVQAVEEELIRARAELALCRGHLRAALGELIPQALHIGDPELLLPGIQRELARTPALADLIDAIAGDEVAEATSDASAVFEITGDAAADEAAVAAGIWLEDALDGAGWVARDAVVLSARAAGINPDALSVAARVLVAVQRREVESGQQWRLALDGAFDAT